MTVRVVPVGFRQASHYTPAGRTSVDLIVLHDMEHPEVPGTAGSVCAWFASPSSPQASAHYNIDAREVWQSVRDQDVAWHAPGANRRGIGLEHAGYANQTAAQWDDPYSHAMLALSARLAADLVERWSIPVGFVDAAGLAAGRRGFTTHAEVTRWQRTAGGHTDPGPNFPVAAYLNLVRAALAGTTREVPVVKVNAPAVAILTHPAWPAGSYIEVCADGGVFGFGGAPFYGSDATHHLNAPIVDATVTPTGSGYWLVGADGGVFTHGDAGFHGAVTDTLNRPVKSITATATGAGYLLLADDGGTFAFGDAAYNGRVEHDA